MNWKKDLKKLTATLPKVDRILLIAAVAAALYCVAAAIWLLCVPSIGRLNAGIQSQQDYIAGMEDKILQQQALVAQAEEDSYALLTAATDEKAAAQADFDAAIEERAGLQADIDAYQQFDTKAEQLKLDIAAKRTEYGQAVRTLEDKILAGESDYKICYLTFDDGPSYLTGSFLDKIDALDIHVTFFTIGCQMAPHAYPLRDEYLRREALSGHTIANHTFTHAIHTSLYKSKDAFIEAVVQQDDLVYSVTGIHTDIVRFPAGSYYSPFRDVTIEELKQMGYGWIDWSANAYDSGTNVNSSAGTANAVLRQVRQEKISVVLMHDWRSETLGALDTIVTKLKAEGYLFLPLFKESSTVGTVYPKWDY